MLKNRIKNTFAIGAALVLVLLVAGTAFGEPLALLTYVKTNGGANPEADSITFTAYYNGDDSKIQTEDSWNDENSNTGYVSSSGSCRVNPVQIGGDQSSQPYEIWISYSGTTEGNQGGNASLDVPGSGIGYTIPNPLPLSGSDYLATPTGFEGAAGNGEALIKWDQVSGATGYRIYKRPSAGESALEIVFERTAIVPSGSTTHLLISGLTNGTTYNFIMVATDPSKRSGHPDEIAITPTASGVPVISGPSSGTKGQSVTITGSNFGSSTGSVYFNGVLASSVTSWADTEIIATIDSGTLAGVGKLIVVSSSNLEGNINFTVNEPLPPVDITTTTLPDGTVGTAYNQTLSATGGTGSYTWSIVSGSLPANLSLNSSSGVISGTPASAGTSSFTVQASSGADSDTQALSITINPLPPVDIITTSLPDGIVGTAYNETLTATGGTGSYTWSIISGSLPAGLSLNSSSGVISATPASAGTSSFIVQASSGANSDTQALSITINPAASNKDFTISYLGETQAENWISVPFNSPQVSGTPINTVGELMDSLVVFTPEPGDIVTLNLYDNTSQNPSFAIRFFNGSSWDSWDPAQEALSIEIGKMYIFALSNPGRPTFSETWTVSGIIPDPGAVTFDISYLSENQAENWISVPNEPSITNNGDLMDSIAGAFTNQTGDIMSLTWYDNATQAPSLAIRFFNGLSWDSWDPAQEALAANLGDPYKVTISNPGRPTFTATWP